MDFSVRLSNSNMVMGNIREMNQFHVKQEKNENDLILDFLFKPSKDFENFDSFKKV